MRQTIKKILRESPKKKKPPRYKNFSDEEILEKIRSIFMGKVFKTENVGVTVTGIRYQQTSFDGKINDNTDTVVFRIKRLPLSDMTSTEGINAYGVDHKKITDRMQKQLRLYFNKSLYCFDDKRKW